MEPRPAVSEQLSIFDFLTVRQEYFEGPLDLLLDLIRQKRMNIQDISLADICEPYLKYLDRMESINVDIAIEFLHIASTLILIKSRSLLPVQEPDDLDEQAVDTEELLRQRLIDYHRYKQAAIRFDSLDQLTRDTFSRPGTDFESEEEPEAQLADTDLFTLINHYHQVLSRKSYQKDYEVDHETDSIEQRLLELLSLIKEGNEMVFSDLVRFDGPKVKVVLTFLAVLELARQYMLRVVQAEEFGGIYLKPSYSDLEELKRLETQYLEIVRTRTLDLDELGNL